MVNINPFIKVNAGGIPRLEAMSVDSTEGLVYTFKPHKFLDYPYAGLILFKLPYVLTTLTEGDVRFTSDGKTFVKVYDRKGELLSGDSTVLGAGGIFIGWYADGVLQLLTGF